jgi:hypothetical protein
LHGKSVVGRVNQKIHLWRVHQRRLH